MRLPIDSNLPPRLARELAEHGHDAVHAAALGGDPGDDALMQFALRERRVIVTQDKDFGALAVQAGAISTGIVRIKRVANRLFLSRIVDAISRHERDLLAGAVLTVEPGRLRVLRLPRP
jgi:predicted nuclease of predicted toxin-antitoxin system